MDIDELAQNYAAHFKTLKADWYYGGQRGLAVAKAIEDAVAARESLRQIGISEPPPPVLQGTGSDSRGDPQASEAQARRPFPLALPDFVLIQIFIIIIQSLRRISPFPFH